MDIKDVPNECKTNNLPDETRYYQYTCIDEATRERFLYWYDEHTPANTVDFIKRCISYYGYLPLEIQTDNGFEFTYNKSKIHKIHPLDKLCLELYIDHHKGRICGSRVLGSRPCGRRSARCAPWADAWATGRSAPGKNGFYKRGFVIGYHHTSPPWGDPNLRL